MHMRSLFGIFLILLMAVSAQASMGTKPNLPYDIKTASCAEILEHTETNNVTRRLAAGVYVHGKHMGKRCMTPDYVKGFELLDRIGARRDMESLLRALEVKASTNNPFAKSQLRKLENAGWIKRLRP